jgi:7-cyano-7-deazaguanine synthase in queuosine biosynthesis
MKYDFICTEGLRPADRRRFRPSSEALEVDFSPSGNVRRTWDEIEFQTGRRLDDPVRDLVELGVSISLADRFSLRDDELDSARHIRILIPVREPNAMNSALDGINLAIRNLRCDMVEIHLAPRQAEDGERELPDPAPEIDADCVCLLSGGMDSFAGAAYAIVKENLHPVLVSYYTKQKTVQQAVKNALEDELGVSLTHIQVGNVRREGKVFSDARNLEGSQESSQRLRSFFYGTLAIAVASAIGVNKIRMVDNAIMTAALPLNASRMGPYSTRTTHPLFLSALESVGTEVVGQDLAISNTLRFWSKSEVARMLDRSGLSDHIGTTESCFRMRTARYKGKRHCGYCVPCILRRLALLATRLDTKDDPQGYAYDLFQFDSLPERGRIDLLDLVSFCGKLDRRSVEDLTVDYGLYFYEFSPNSDEVSKIIEVHKIFGAEVLRVLRRDGSNAFRRRLGL